MQVKTTVNKYHITKEENIKGLYWSIKSRVGKPGSYKNKKLLITWEDFYHFVSKDKQYNRIYKEWVANDFYTLLSPTVNRINNNGHYSIDNIQILTRLDNSRKGTGNSAIKEREDYKLYLKDKRNEIILFLKSQGYNDNSIATMFGMNRSSIKRITDKFVMSDEKKRYKLLKD